MMMTRMCFQLCPKRTDCELSLTDEQIQEAMDKARRRITKDQAEKGESNSNEYALQLKPCHLSSLLVCSLIRVLGSTRFTSLSLQHFVTVVRSFAHSAFPLCGLFLTSL